MATQALYQILKVEQIVMWLNKKKEDKSHICDYCLDVASNWVNAYLQRDAFQDLEFLYYLHIIDENTSLVQDLFYWNEDVIAHLNFCNPTGYSMLTGKTKAIFLHVLIYRVIIFKTNG